MPFKEHNINSLVYLTASTLRVTHAFTTRLGGVSSGGLASLNMGANRGDAPENVSENFRLLGVALGIDLTSSARTHQVHGSEVRVVTEADRLPALEPTPFEADGLVTNVPGLPIICFIADCVPVLLHDPVKGVAAAVHCGWKSSVLDILGQAVIKMEALGARPANLCAAIGPSIGPCCFETDSDVPDALRAWLGAEAEEYIFTGKTEGKYQVDLRRANARRLMQLGVSAGSIAVSEECTMCRSDRFWSHRATRGGARGSQCALICL